MKEAVVKAMNNQLITSKEEAESAIEFVRDLLEISIEETQKNEPYATNSINEMRIAIRQIGYTLDLLEE